MKFDKAAPGPFLNKTKLDLILNELNLYRGHILTTVEIYLKETPHWPDVRSRILSLLGDRGLAGSMVKILGGKGGSK